VLPQTKKFSRIDKKGIGPETLKYLHPRNRWKSPFWYLGPISFGKWSFKFYMNMLQSARTSSPIFIYAHCPPGFSQILALILDLIKFLAYHLTQLCSSNIYSSLLLAQFLLCLLKIFPFGSLPTQQIVSPHPAYSRSILDLTPT
jgi:hypothetical protein